MDVVGAPTIITDADLNFEVAYIGTGSISIDGSALQRFEVRGEYPLTFSYTSTRTRTVGDSFLREERARVSVTRFAGTSFTVIYNRLEAAYLTGTSNTFSDTVILA